MGFLTQGNGFLAGGL
ncbi:hypothetical protein E2C01_101245 [Portunus trituberculatus]|uniref:Uncharacterized protein n=1 Tax=Portunus trituberculatus TaxID=210409 RepID=A0A5B7KJM8_PORTR|nr:hypothetical protein [Portunus trituberculatus]